MFIACLQEFPFTVVVSENVFFQSMVALVNPVCGFLSGMLYAHKSEVRVAVFETRWPPKGMYKNAKQRNETSETNKLVSE